MAPNTPFEREDRALQEAIQESLKARAANMETQFGDLATISGAELEQPVHQRISIEDRIKDLVLRAATELPLVDDLHADTWVFIDPPQKQPEQDQHDYQHYVKRYQAPISMKKETLVKYSPFLAKAFAPTAQFRINRRRKLVKELADTPNIKYVIDLTPPTEGEEAVYLTTELCCSEGIRLWYQASEIWKVSKLLVGGEEEYTSVRLWKVPSTLPSVPEAQGWDDSIAGVNEASIPKPSPPSLPKITSALMPLEYSPVRHRSAIERVLSALQGKDPQLDSAPKLWTTFAVAKYLEIQHSELDSYIIRWLRAYPNSYFLEVLPEVSLQIADGLENYDLARDSFAILVGEEALDNLRRARKHNITDKRSAYGRKKEELPEAIFTRVEYASKIFLERITDEFTGFVSNGMQWMDNLAEFQRLSSHTEPELQDTIHALKALLKDYVRGAIYNLLCVNYDSVPGAELHHQGGQDLLPRVSRSDVWIDLSPNERLLSRTFWQALTSFKKFDGSTNLDIKEGWDMKWDSIKLSSVEKRELDRGTYREIRKDTLNALVRAGERWIAHNETAEDCWLPHNEPQISSTLPIRNRSEAYVASAETDEPSGPMQAVDPLYGAQILAADPDTGTTRTTNIRRPCTLARETFDVGSTPIPDGPVGHGADIDWPFGAPRRDSALNMPGNLEGIRDPPYPKLDSGINKGQTDQVLSQWPAPEGFSSWSGRHDSDKIEELRDVLLEQQQIPEESLTPPFFKENVALRSTMPLSSEWRILPMPQGHRNQQDVDEPITLLPTRKTRAAFFNLAMFFSQADRYINAFARQKLQYPDQSAREEPHEIGITNTLTSLQDSEWKYLPLWAGGNDDGSGGVYIEQPPTADLGFSTPGPEVHTGDTPAPSTISPSEADFEMVDGHATDTSTNTSMVNNRSFANHMHRNRVYAADSADTSSHESRAASDDFTMVTEDDEEELARSQIEAQERIEAAEEKAEKEAKRVEKSKEKMIDENYADLFDDDEDDMDDDGDDTDRAESGDFEEFEDEDGDLILVEELRGSMKQYGTS